MRVDSGVVEGDTVSGAFDSMVAKLIVTGADRRQALARARRALAELEIQGIATVIPFHRAVVREPDFAPVDDGPFRIHTRWIETEFAERLSDLGEPTSAADHEAEQQVERVTVEVGGKRLEIVIPAGLAIGGRRPGAAPRRAATRRTQRGSTASANGTTLASPMQGTIVKVAVAEGATVAEGDLVVVLEAMKMEQPLVAHRAGVVRSLITNVGASVSAGGAICQIVD